jgi:hypothetical protein
MCAAPKTQPGRSRHQAGAGLLHRHTPGAPDSRAHSLATDPRVVAQFRKDHVPPTRAPPPPGAAHPLGAGPALGACPCGRVIARFRKTTSATTCARRSPRRSPGRRTRPERVRRQEPAPVEGRCGISQKPKPPRPVSMLPQGRGPARVGPAGRSLPPAEAGLLRNFAKKCPQPPTGCFPSRPAPSPSIAAIGPDAELRWRRHSARSATLPFRAPRVSKKNRKPK